MIVADASALLAIHLAEPERDRFAALLTARRSVMSPANLWEALVRAEALDPGAGRGKIQRLIEGLSIEIVPIDAESARVAVDAFARFGKRTPAALNLGDCFAYALAQQCGAPLLYKGDDLAKTDVLAA